MSDIGQRNCVGSPDGNDMRVCLNGNASETSTDTNRGLECLAHQGELQSQVGIGVKQPRKLLTLPASAQSSNHIVPSSSPSLFGRADIRSDGTKVGDPFTAKLSLLVKQDNCHIEYVVFRTHAV